MVGAFVICVGVKVGADVGVADGAFVVGDKEGLCEGRIVGVLVVGERVGLLVVGPEDGEKVGVLVQLASNFAVHACSGTTTSPQSVHSLQS